MRHAASRRRNAGQNCGWKRLRRLADLRLTRSGWRTAMTGAGAWPTLLRRPGAAGGLHNGAAAVSLYDPYVEPLFDYAVTLLGDAQRAADVIHDTVVDAVYRAPRGQSPEQSRSWLYAAARRRIWQRKPGPYLSWQQAETPPSSTQVSALRDAVLNRLDTVEQEALLLAVRHGMGPDTLARTLGLSSRTTIARLRTARLRADAALTAEHAEQVQICAGRETRRGAPPGQPTMTLPHDHLLGCATCLRRGHLTIGDLLTDAAPMPAPATLRRRLLHTCTDTELAAHRNDIVARGGPLTPDRVPRQLDAPSDLPRRSASATITIAAAGGTAAALTTLVSASLAVGTALLPLVIPLEGTPGAAHASPRRHQPSATPVAGSFPAPPGSPKPVPDIPPIRTAAPPAPVAPTAPTGPGAPAARTGPRAPAAPIDPDAPAAPTGPRAPAGPSAPAAPELPHEPAPIPRTPPPKTRPPRLLPPPPKSPAARLLPPGLTTRPRIHIPPGALPAHRPLRPSPPISLTPPSVRLPLHGLGTLRRNPLRQVLPRQLSERTQPNQPNRQGHPHPLAAPPGQIR